MSDVNDDLMLLYVAGVCDAYEAEQAEAVLSAAGPVAAAMMAEAVCVFHAVPFGLVPVEPPAHCRQALLGRITADVSADAAAALRLVPGVPAAAAFAPAAAASPSSFNIASRLRWPLYVSSGLAACLAVALTTSMWSGRQMAQRLAVMSERDESMSNTLATAREVMASPKLTLASLNTQEPIPVASAGSPAAPPFGRGMFCPINRRYTFAVYNLRPLPPDRKYELWLIADGRPPVPAALFSVGPDGSAMVVAQVGPSAEPFRQAAITDEPAGGSNRPTGAPHMAGALPVQ